MEREYVQGSAPRDIDRCIVVPPYWLTIGLDSEASDMNGVSQPTLAFQLYQAGYDEETAVMMARSSTSH